MTNKIDPDILLRPAQKEGQKEEIENGRKIDERFRAALRRGETSGDFVVLDEHGDEIVGALPSKTIFDF